MDKIVKKGWATPEMDTVSINDTQRGNPNGNPNGNGFGHCKHDPAGNNGIGHDYYDITCS